MEEAKHAENSEVKEKKDKKKNEKAPKEKITDSAKLRQKIEKLDAKMDALRAKKEGLVKQLFDLEKAADGGKPAKEPES